LACSICWSAFSAFDPVISEVTTGEGDDYATQETAIAWIVANQLGRRNLTPSQKAALALELEKQLAIEAKKKEAQRKMTLEKIPKSPLPVVHTAAILEHVKQGTLSIPQAKKVAALPAEERPTAIASACTLPRKKRGGCTVSDPTAHARVFRAPSCVAE
jgi:hypothetical protein